MQTQILPFAEVLLKNFRFFGQDVFYLLLMALGYWVGPRRFFRDLGLLICLATLTNVALKYAFKIPRPVGHPRELVLDPYGMPSGDIQLTVATFLALADFFRHRMFWALAAFMSTGVGLSRLYLGVHTPADVLVGACVGGLCFVAFKALRMPPVRSFWEARPLLGSSLLCALVGFIVWRLPGPLLPIATVPAGVLFGFVCSQWLQVAVPLEPLAGSPLLRLALCPAGLLGLFALRASLKPFCINPLSFILVFAFLGLYLLYVFPLCMQALLGLRRLGARLQTFI